MRLHEPAGWKLPGVEVDEHFHAGKVLAQVGDYRYGEAGVGGVESHNVVRSEIQVLGKIYCTLVVKPLRDYGKAAYTIHLYGPHHRVEGAVAFAVENDVAGAHSALHERIPHAHHLIHAVEAVVVAAYENLAYLAGLVELLGSFDAILEEVVLFAPHARLWSGAQQQSIVGGRYAFNLGVHLALGVAYDYTIAHAHYQHAHNSCRAHSPQ